MGTDFDLYLYKWQRNRWRKVDSSLSYTSEEEISYSASSGYYVWGVESYQGSGSYDMCMSGQ